MTPEWIIAYSEVATAFGTIGAVITALVLASADGRRRRREEERCQAEHISAWMENLPLGEEVVIDGETYVKLIIQNASAQLVYSTIASIVNAQTEDSVGGVGDYFTYVGRLPPGRSEYDIRHPGHGMHKKFSIELAFEDARGKSWVRRGKVHHVRAQQRDATASRMGRYGCWISAVSRSMKVFMLTSGASFCAVLPFL